jgi:sorbose reductase
MSAPATSTNGTTPSNSAPDVDINSYLRNSVQDLISLKGRTIVITGGARGLGLAFAFAVAEVGANVAIVDALDTPHEHFYRLEKEFNVKTKLYK